jgi:hypothetical protein
VVRRFGFGKRKTLYQRRAKREKYKVSADWATTDIRPPIKVQRNKPRGPLVASRMRDKESFGLRN